MAESFDVLVVGGGIAGAAAAAALAPQRSVLVAEAEDGVDRHATGRSVAHLLPWFGNEADRALTRASRARFEDPPPGSAARPILRPRAMLTAYGERRRDFGERYAPGGWKHTPAVELFDRSDLFRRWPFLKAERLLGGVRDPEAADIDVEALHGSFLFEARSHGAELRLAHPLRKVRQTGGRWQAMVGETTITADCVVNAAGAFADRVADLAGVDPVGILPLRRTVVLVDLPAGAGDWDMVTVIDHPVYFKPYGDSLLVSPSDETVTEPGFPEPDPADVQSALDGIAEWTHLDVGEPRSAWAGHRPAAPDRHAVIGREPGTPTFVWSAGHGGTGIQTAPAAGLLVAAACLGTPPPAGLLDAGVEPALHDPARFRSARAGA